MANAIADSEAFSIAGGGDTLAAIDLFGIADKISYISTGGGAFLEFVEGKVECGVTAIFVGQLGHSACDVIFHTAGQSALCGANNITPRIVPFLPDAA